MPLKHSGLSLCIKFEQFKWKVKGKACREEEPVLGSGQRRKRCEWEYPKDAFLPFSFLSILYAEELPWKAYLSMAKAISVPILYLCSLWKYLFILYYRQWSIYIYLQFYYGCCIAFLYGPCYLSCKVSTCFFFSFKKGMYVCLGFFVGRGHFLKYIYKYIRVYECEWLCLCERKVL